MVYKLLYWITFWYFHTLMKFFVRAKKVGGLELISKLKGPLIIAANHRGRIDGIWIWYYCALMNPQKLIDMRIITGARFFEIPIVGWYLKQMKCFPVTSGNGVEVLDPMVDVLKRNGIVTIFPEGKMQKHPNHRGEAKRGVGYLIEQTAVPVLPIYINYHKRIGLIPVWDLTFRVGELHSYDIIKNEDNLKIIADSVLNSIYEINNK
jgi:1-acyl-sn-glycerol-3-phosphate acyltransferase